MESIKDLSNQVFSLSDEEKIILKTLTDGPLNSYQVYQKTKNRTIVKLQRAGVDNWLDRSQKRPSLNELEFVLKKYVGKTKTKQDEFKYYLTTKGMLAVLSETNIDEIYLFNKYCEFLSNKINDKKLFDSIKKFIKGQVEVFLAWHYTYGIKLHDLKQSQTYFRKFFESVDENVYTQFPPLDKKLQSIKPILEDYHVAATVLYFLDEAANPKNEHYDFFEGMNPELNKQIYSKLKFFALHIERWYLYLEKLQDANWQLISLPIKYQKTASIDLEKSNKKIKSTLLRLGMDKKFIDSVLHVMSNYSHTKLGTADDLKATEAVFGI